jgi:hypothetical protein
MTRSENTQSKHAVNCDSLNFVKKARAYPYVISQSHTDEQFALRNLVVFVSIASRTLQSSVLEGMVRVFSWASSWFGILCFDVETEGVSGVINLGIACISP